MNIKEIINKNIDLSEETKNEKIKLMNRIGELFNYKNGTINLEEIAKNYENKEIEKKVPDNNICGNANKLMSSGIVESDFTILEKINPTPIKVSNIIKLIPTISINVIKPCANVNPKNNFPTTINTTTFNN